VLSFGIPFALVPLVVLTRRADIMGPLVNHRITTVTTGCIVAMIIILNGCLLYATFNPDLGPPPSRPTCSYSRV